MRFKILATALLMVVLFSGAASAQTEAQLRIAFQNIRNDDIPNNGGAAAAWLNHNRNQITTALLDELYRTDMQGRGAIATTLLGVKSFVPDERFFRVMLRYLNGDNDELGNMRARAWRFFLKHRAKAKPFLMENLQKTDSIWCIWATTSYLQAIGELDAALPSFSPHIWQVACKNLQDDKVGHNAGDAASFFLLVGKSGLPHLQPLLQSKDTQTQDYSAALIDSMNGSRRAYGFLGAEVLLQSEDVFGNGDNTDWFDSEVEKWDPHGRPQRYSK